MYGTKVTGVYDFMESYCNNFMTYMRLNVIYIRFCNEKEGGGG